MLNRDDVRMALGVGAIVVTLGVGTCSTNSRIDDTHRRIDDTNRRMDEGFANTNRRMDEGFANIYRRLDDMQTDIREIRTLLFETIKNNPPGD
ncbi:MAG: hypothetical protein F4137_24315 [Acidobacteria bacterium]|nr:hypothetical protein [Acidobacteriota bacterium]